jgi:hypothetical protein
MELRLLEHLLHLAQRTHLEEMAA